MKKQTKSIVRNVSVLTLITIVAGFALALTFNLTRDKIAEAERQEMLKSIRFVLPKDDQGNPIFTNAPDRMKFTMKMEAPEGEVHEEITFFPALAEDGRLVGFAVKAISKIGYGGDIGLMIGIDPNGKIYETYILSMLETPGLGTKINEDFKDQFIGKSIGADDNLILKKDDRKKGDIDAITGATISSRAMTNTVRKAINFYLENKTEIIEKVVEKDDKANVSSDVIDDTGNKSLHIESKDKTDTDAITDATTEATRAYEKKKSDKSRNKKNRSQHLRKRKKERSGK